jgi:hypothetical protein
MLPLKAKTIWEEKKEDIKNNTLIVRIEKTQVISDKPSVPERTCVIEISSPSEDDPGQQIKKRLEVSVDAKVLDELREAILALKRLQSKQIPKNETGTVQIRHEGQSGLVVMYELEKRDRCIRQSSQLFLGAPPSRFLFGGRSFLF